MRCLITYIFRLLLSLDSHQKLLKTVFETLKIYKIVLGEGSLDTSVWPPSLPQSKFLAPPLLYLVDHKSVSQTLESV